MTTHTRSRTSVAPHYLRRKSPLLGLIVKIFYHLTLTYQNSAMIECLVPCQLLHVLNYGP